MSKKTKASQLEKESDLKENLKGTGMTRTPSPKSVKKKKDENNPKTI